MSLVKLVLQRKVNLLFYCAFWYTSISLLNNRFILLPFEKKLMVHGQPGHLGELALLLVVVAHKIAPDHVQILPHNITEQRVLVMV